MKNLKIELTELVNELIIYHGLPQKENDDEFYDSYMGATIHLISSILDIENNSKITKHQKELIDYLDYKMPDKEIEKLISPMCNYKLYCAAQK